MNIHNEPLVSVCIQTYQHAAYIKECLDSVLVQQTNFPFEIILGEDDSTDGTRDICTTYAANHPVIRLFLRSEKDKIYINGEKTGRFNFIHNLKAARGKYIALLDGDDYWTDKAKLQKQVDFMGSNPDCSVSFHKTLRCLKTGRPYLPEDYNLPEINTRFTLDDLLEENMINAASCMFLRSNLDDMPAWWWELPFLDYPLHLHSAQKGKIGFLAEAMAVYRIHPGGMWTSKAAPANLIKLWHMYSILSANINGKLGTLIQDKRYKTGMELISFYKTHLWKKNEWLKKELEQNNFPADEDLLQQFHSHLSTRDYILNCRNYARETVRRIVKGA